MNRKWRLTVEDSKSVEIYDATSDATSDAGPRITNENQASENWHNKRENSKVKAAREKQENGWEWRAP